MLDGSYNPLQWQARCAGSQLTGGACQQAGMRHHQDWGHVQQLRQLGHPLLGERVGEQARGAVAGGVGCQAHEDDLLREGGGGGDGGRCRFKYGLLANVQGFT